MDSPFSRPARIAAALIAVLAFATIALQTTINQGGQTSPLAAFALLFRYFTIWSNAAAGVILALVALNRRIPAWVLFALATALTQVGIVYHSLLAADHHPVGLDWWTNLSFHTAIPLSAVLWWLAFARMAMLTWRSLPAVMIAPVVYTIFALVYGHLSGFYPYFFLDQPQFGWPRILLNIAGLALFFVLLGALLLLIRKGVVRSLNGPS